MLSCQRHLFSLPEDLHYLNCAAQSPLPQRVSEAAQRAIAAKVNPALSNEGVAFGPVEALRGIVGKLVNAPAGRVAIIPSVSYGVATALKNITIGPGHRQSHAKFCSTNCRVDWNNRKKQRRSK